MDTFWTVFGVLSLLSAILGGVMFVTYMLATMWEEGTRWWHWALLVLGVLFALAAVAGLAQLIDTLTT